jgi:hypothetical protein
MGSLANARTALASELRMASPVRPWCLYYGPRAAASEHSTRARRRTRSRLRRMDSDGAEMVARWTKERSPGGGPGAEDSETAGRWGGRADNGTFRRSKGRDLDAS